MPTPSVYVSITGLKLKSKWHVLRFWWHAGRSFRQALNSPGNLRTEARKINGIQHTMTVWRSKADMRAFLYSGAHKQAIKAFHIIATGKTFGFETNKPPNWSQVPALWREYGKDY